MYKHRIHERLASSKPAAWNSVLATCADLNRLSRVRGWPQISVWTQVVGPFNQMVFEAEYESLDVFGRNQEALFADAESLGIIDRLNDVLDKDFGWSELWQQAVSVPDLPE